MAVSKHLKYGGSTAARTMACPAWHKLSENLPRGPESDAATRGTDLHNVLENCVSNDEDAFIYEGQTMGGTLMTPELLDEKIAPALKAYDTLMDQYEVTDFDAEVFVQHTASDDIGGTVDFMARGSNYLVIADYKSGDGHLVEPFDNAQMGFYAMCAVADPAVADMVEGLNNLVFAIVQPTARREEVLLTWECNIGWLKEFRDQYLRAVVDAEAGVSTPVAGPHCQFCPAQAICPVKTGMAQKALKIDTASIEHGQLSGAMEMAQELEGWCKAVMKMGHEQMEQGLAIDGFKLVQKRGTRKWTDEAGAEHKLRKMRRILNSEAFDEVMKSPAKIDKLCASKKIDFSKEFKSYYDSVSSGTTVTKSDDPREEAIPVLALKAMADKLS